MKTITVITGFCLLVSLSGYGQAGETDKVAKSEVSKLSFITGEWKGSGWMTGQDRSRHSFIQTETIRFKLDSTAILIEGFGMSDEKVIHNALAIITYNKENNNYTFDSYLSTGLSGKFKAELTDGRLYWYPRENIRYIIYLNDKGQWYETGEMNRGGTWYQFFEMTLDKK
jgi:hypothetical protein